MVGLPIGKLRIEEPQDDGTIWHLGIEITEDNFIVDLRDVAPVTLNNQSAKVT